MPGHQRGRQRRRSGRRALRSLARNGSNRGRSTTPIRPRGNSPILTSRGLGVVLGDLASLGFNAEWGVVSAADANAPHLRERIWILAYTSGQRHRVTFETLCAGRDTIEPGCEALAYTDHDEINRRCGALQVGRSRCAQEDGHHGVELRNEWPSEPNVGRVAHGVAHRVERLNALGNGQVPRVAAAAFRILMEASNV